MTDVAVKPLTLPIFPDGKGGFRLGSEIFNEEARAELMRKHNLAPNTLIEDASLLANNRQAGGTLEDRGFVTGKHQHYLYGDDHKDVQTVCRSNLAKEVLGYRPENYGGAFMQIRTHDWEQPDDEECQGWEQTTRFEQDGTVLAVGLSYVENVETYFGLSRRVSAAIHPLLLDMLKQCPMFASIGAQVCENLQPDNFVPEEIFSLVGGLENAFPVEGAGAARQLTWTDGTGLRWLKLKLSKDDTCDYIKFQLKLRAANLVESIRYVSSMISDGALYNKVRHVRIGE